MKKLGIALGGGGSRALCHLGVLSVLEDEGFDIAAISGSSMGGLLAAMYSFEPDAKVITGKASQYFKKSSLFGGARKQDKGDGLRGGLTAWGRILKYLRTAILFNILSIRSSLLKRNPTLKAVESLLPDSDISTAKVPFSCNALDMTEGRLMTFKTGNVRTAVVAGTAVGIVFPPHKWNGKHYSDAAPVSSVPVNAVRELGAEVIVAIDIRSPVKPMPDFHNGFDVVSRLEMISAKILNDQEVAGADIIIRPPVLDVFWGDFSNVEGIVETGRQAAREIIPQLRQIMEQPENSTLSRI